MESFNGNLQDELLNVEVFDTLWEAKVLAERWRREYHQRRPHSALAYRPPAAEVRFLRSQAQSYIPWSKLQTIPNLTHQSSKSDSYTIFYPSGHVRLNRLSFGTGAKEELSTWDQPRCTGPR